MNPFDLPGPEFIALYVVSAGLALTVTMVLRWWVRLPADAPPDEVLNAIKPYEIAYLRSGPHGALISAFAALIHRGRVQVDASGAISLVEDAEPSRELVADGVYRSVALPGADDPLERAILDAVAGGLGTLEPVAEQCELALDELEERLVEWGLMRSARSFAVRTWALPIPALLVFAFGAIKILVGIGRERPVCFLAILVPATLLMLLIRERRRRTRRGDAALDLLELRNSALLSTARAAPEQLTDSDVALTTGLFGPSTSWGAAFVGLVALGASSFIGLPEQGRALMAQSTTRSWFGGTSCSAGLSCGGGSSCGGSSCGSSCGGGCGGGCGGCGG